MGWNRKRRALLRQFEQRLESTLAGMPARVEKTLKKKRSTAQRVATTTAWVTGALAVLGAGLYAGNELRSRYKFKRRTPYDYYSHSGDRVDDVEFGVGV